MCIHVWKFEGIFKGRQCDIPSILNNNYCFWHYEDIEYKEYPDDVVNYFEERAKSGLPFQDFYIPGIILNEANLRKADFRGANLLRSKIIHADLREANFESANLFHANLKTSKLWKANFSKSNLSSANLYGTKFREADFSNADLTNAVIVNSIGRKANFQDCILIDAKLWRTKFYESNFENANLTGTRMPKVHLENTNFKNCNLTACNLYKSFLTDGNFENCNFTDARFEEAILINSNFTKAKLVRANMHKSVFSGWITDGIIFEDVVFGEEDFARDNHLKWLFYQSLGKTVLEDTFEKRNKLGSGAAGTVYSAQVIKDTGIFKKGDIVAIKEFKDWLFNLPNQDIRIKREVDAGRMHNNKHLLKVYQDFQSGNNIFIVMQYIDGVTLFDWVKQNHPLRCSHVLDIFYQICDGLLALHEMDIIHRDLKPQNIMIENKTNIIKLMDFGVIKDINSSDITESQSFLGTIEYSSPEFLLCKDIDKRSDLYSLGAILFFLLAGKGPFEDIKNRVRLSQAVLNEQINIPNNIDKSYMFLIAVTQKLLSKDPKDRYSSIEEMLIYLKSQNNRHGGNLETD